MTYNEPFMCYNKHTIISKIVLQLIPKSLYNFFKGFFLELDRNCLTWIWSIRCNIGFTSRKNTKILSKIQIVDLEI
jgi:hypothetical protein